MFVCFVKKSSSVVNCILFEATCFIIPVKISQENISKDYSLNTKVCYKKSYEKIILNMFCKCAPKWYDQILNTESECFHFLVDFFFKLTFIF